MVSKFSRSWNDKLYDDEFLREGELFVETTSRVVVDVYIYRDEAFPFTRPVLSDGYVSES